jgi:hypothetical protein
MMRAFTARPVVDEGHAIGPDADDEAVERQLASGAGRWPWNAVDEPRASARARTRRASKRLHG